MIASLLPSPRLAFLLSTLAGAAAAFDPALRPRFEILGLFALFVLALDDLRGALAPGRVRPGRVTADLVAVALASALLVAQRGWPMLWVVVALGLMQLALLAGPRLEETALAAPLTIAILGPLTTGGAALALVEHLAPQAFWIGLPIGFLADAGRRARSTAAAAPGVPGAPGAPPWFAGDLVAAFGVVPALVLSAALPWSALASWLALPLATREALLARGGYSWPAAAGRMRLLLASFAALLATAVFLARFFATRAV